MYRTRTTQKSDSVRYTSDKNSVQERSMGNKSTRWDGWDAKVTEEITRNKTRNKFGHKMGIWREKYGIRPIAYNKYVRRK